MVLSTLFLFLLFTDFFAPFLCQLLLPFGLSPYADAGYKNKSLIAMFAVGAACLIAYVVWEGWFARFPSAPMRLIKNRTFINAIIIDFIYMMAGYMQVRSRSRSRFLTF